jgi:hypothetical protein
MTPTSRTRTTHRSVLGALVVAAAGVSCRDPVLDDTVKAQGKETQGIPVGEFHRAGQRCTICHQDTGPASQAYALAGTIFAQPNRQVGVGKVEIRLTDSDGTKFTAKTNCVGNFFITASDWTPKFPILVAIAKNGSVREMTSPIGRATDCAECHTLAIPPVDPFSQMPQIYLYTSDEPGQPDGDPTCPVDPVRPGSP